MKKIITLLCSLALVFTFSTASNALAAPQDAETFLKSGITDLLSILSDPNYNNPEFHTALRLKAEDSVMQLFDFEEFSMRTLGARWKAFTKPQQEKFTVAFTHLLRNTYISALNDYNGEEVIYKSLIDSDNGTRVEIQTVIKSGGKDIPFAFRMLEKDNKWVVYDVLIEGVSLIKNYREQFGDLLTKATPDVLIERIEMKAQEVMTKKN